MTTVIDRYQAATARSAAHFEAATRVMPGGDTRTAAHHPPYPLTLARGDGAYVWDVDGNQYVDCLSNYSSLVHGHHFAPVVDAVTRVLAHGTVWPALHEHQVRLAELLCARVASIELVRFCNSGTEAGMLAVKIARRVTGRRKVLVAATSYHGSYDGLEGGRYNARGQDVLSADYGDAASFEAALDKHGDDIALVMCEAIQGRGVVTPPPAFLGRVRDAAHRHGALFGLDEVQTLRLAHGGQQSVAGIAPDITIMGKIIGGGFPVGAVGGSAAVLGVTDPRRADPLILTGTFNGNLVTCAAGLAAMTHLDAATIERLNARGDRLRSMIEEAAAKTESGVTVANAGSLLNLYWDHPPHPEVTADQAVGLLHLAALNEGVFLSPHGYLALNTAIDDQLLDSVGERLAAAIAAAADSLGSGS